MATPIPNFIQTTAARNTTSYQDGVMPMAASAVISAYSARYVTSDGSGNYALTTATSTQIDGWVSTCYASDHSGSSTSSSTTPITCSSTAGATVLTGTRQVHSEDDACWIGSIETLVASNKGKKCDLIVTANIQQVKPSVTTHLHVIILDVDLVNNLALVYANPTAS